MIAPARSNPSSAIAAPRSPGNPHFALFDGLRGLAVLAILGFHSAELTGRLGFGAGGRLAEVAGAEAVIVFFVISGFLLYRPFVAARAAGRPIPSLRRYARNRALRILPGYWTVLTLLAIFPGVVGVFSGHWWRFYGYLQLYSARTEGQGIPVAWTLCVEVTFYLALPLWAAGVRRLGRGLRGELAALALIALAGAAIQLAAARQHIGYAVGVSLPGQCTWLALGMAVAVLSVRANERQGPAGRTPAGQASQALGNQGVTNQGVANQGLANQKQANQEQAHDAPVSTLTGAALRLAAHPAACWCGAAAAVAGLAVLVPRGGLFGLISVINTPQPWARAIARILLEAVTVTLVVLPVAFEHEGRGWPRRLLRRRPVMFLGVISYSFYLWHLTVGELIATPGDRGAFSAGGLGLLTHLHFAATPVIFGLTLVATGALAAISYRAVELPFLRRKPR